MSNELAKAQQQQQQYVTIPAKYMRSDAVLQKPGKKEEQVPSPPFLHF